MNSSVTPGRGQRPHPLEEPRDRRRVEPGGRLVEDDEPGAERQRPRDLDELALLDRQITASAPGSTATPYSSSTAAAARRSRPQRIGPPPDCRLRNRFSATESVGMMVERW